MASLHAETHWLPLRTRVVHPNLAVTRCCDHFEATTARTGHKLRVSHPHGLAQVQFVVRYISRSKQLLLRVERPDTEIALVSTDSYGPGARF